MGEGPPGNEVMGPRDFALAGVDVEKRMVPWETGSLVALRLEGGRESTSSDALISLVRIRVSSKSRSITPFCSDDQSSLRAFLRGYA